MIKAEPERCQIHCLKCMENLKEQAEQYAALIMEELEPNHFRYIEIQSMELLLLEVPNETAKQLGNIPDRDGSVFDKEIDIFRQQLLLKILQRTQAVNLPNTPASRSYCRSASCAKFAGLEAG